MRVIMMPAIGQIAAMPGVLPCSRVLDKGDDYCIEDVSMAPSDLIFNSKNFRSRGFQALYGVIRTKRGATGGEDTTQRVFFKVFQNPGAVDSFALESLWPYVVDSNPLNNAFMKKHFCLPMLQFGGRLTNLFVPGAKTQLQKIPIHQIKRHFNSKDDYKSDYVSNVPALFLAFPLEQGQDLFQFCKRRRTRAQDAMKEMKRCTSQLRIFSQGSPDGVDPSKIAVSMRAYEIALAKLRKNMPSRLLFVEAYRQLKGVLDFLHSRGLAHNDMDASNIMLRRVNGEITFVLVDFGTCTKTRMNDPFTGKAFLTPPEWIRSFAQLPCERKCGGRYARDKADLFALGVSLFVLMTYAPPWECNGSRMNLLKDKKYIYMTRKCAYQRAKNIKGIVSKFWEQLYVEYPIAVAFFALHRRQARERYLVLQKIVSRSSVASSFNTLDGYELGKACGETGAEAIFTICSQPVAINLACEKGAFLNTLRVYPTGCVSVVSGGCEYKDAMKKLWCGDLVNIVKGRFRNAKSLKPTEPHALIIRLDSGDVVKSALYALKHLAGAYGFTQNALGFKTLSDEVKLIQGEGTSMETYEKLLEALHENKWSVANLAARPGGAPPPYGAEDYAVLAALFDPDPSSRACTSTK